MKYSREVGKISPYFLLTTEIMTTEVELSMIAFFSSCTQYITTSVKTTCL